MERGGRRAVRIARKSSVEARTTRRHGLATPRCPGTEGAHGAGHAPGQRRICAGGFADQARSARCAVGQNPGRARPGKRVVATPPVLGHARQLWAARSPAPNYARAPRAFRAKKPTPALATRHPAGLPSNNVKDPNIASYIRHLHPLPPLKSKQIKTI